MDKAYGAVAGRIALGKSSGKGQKSHTGTSNFKTNSPLNFWLLFFYLAPVSPGHEGQEAGCPQESQEGLGWMIPGSIA